MYNSDIPTRADLPTSRQLLRSTIIAILAAAVILITVVLPAEYAIDPTGIGRILKLTEMGEIKAQLAGEVSTSPAVATLTTAPTTLALKPLSIVAATAASDWRDEMSLTLAPNKGAEIKLRMRKGAKANFSWSVEGGVVSFDKHGDGDIDKQFISYEKGRNATFNEGELEAAFDGVHGWFWRNTGESDVKVLLRTRGDYVDIKKIL
jgi:hypothetical protein